MAALCHGLVIGCFYPISPPNLECFEDGTERNRGHQTEIKGLHLLDEGPGMP